MAKKNLNWEFNDSKLNPRDLFPSAANIYDSLIPKIDMPKIDVAPVGELFENIAKKQDEQIEKQNQVIENQNQQITELQKLGLKKDEEINELKTINNKKDAELIEAQNSAKKESKKWWITTGLTILALILAFIALFV